jgi:uncharacterized membrane protein
MEILDYSSLLFRWIHIIAGILWIGMLYFFNFAYTPFAGTMDGETKKKVIPELLPRALFWFRWGAAFTWITGFLMIMIIFDIQKAAYADPLNIQGPGRGLQYLFLVAPFIYDALAKSALTKNWRVWVVICYILILGTICLLTEVGGFGYRGYVLHMGAIFGSIMAYNVWFRIWPNQKKIMTAIKTGNAPDAALVAQTGMRSKHNVYMSVPLIWSMINSHSVALHGEYGWVWYAGVVLVGWHTVLMLYKRAAKVKGF